MRTDETGETEVMTYGKKTLVQVVVAAFVILAIVLLWKGAKVFLIIFAGMLLAIFLHSPSKWTSQKVGLPEKWSLAVVLLALLLATAGAI